MSIDLHIHTTASDGDIDPVTVVRMAAAAKLKIIALADHESTSGYHPAYRECQVQGLTVIPAVELLTYYKDREVHVLGYFQDPDNKYLQDQLAELRHQRTECSRQAVKLLNEYGYCVPWSDVLKLGQPGSPISKGHIMQALNNAGYFRDPTGALEFLTKYLNREGLAYVCHTFPFESGIDLIRSTGGIPVLAHPGLIRDDQIVEELCAKDVAAMEVYYYYFGQYRNERVEKYRAMAEEKGLLKTGGSDYHGTYTPVTLGENPVPYEGVKEFLLLSGVSM